MKYIRLHLLQVEKDLQIIIFCLFFLHNLLSSLELGLYLHFILTFILTLLNYYFLFTYIITIYLIDILPILFTFVFFFFTFYFLFSLTLLTYSISGPNIPDKMFCFIPSLSGNTCVPWLVSVPIKLLNPSHPWQLFTRTWAHAALPPSRVHCPASL